MDSQSYKTKYLNKSTVQREWLIVDAKDQVLGRLASRVAIYLRGKHKPSFTPHVDCGDKVIVINADKVKLTGRKADQREHMRYSGYQSGQKRLTPREILNGKHPERLVELAVRRMLPKNKLGSQVYKNLKVYAGEEHPHEAQEPKAIELNN